MAARLDETGAAILDENGQPIDDGLAVVPRSTDDYAAALLSLLPSGAAWPKDAGSVQATVATALSATYARMDERLIELLSESPAGGGLVEMLPEWESTLGLPDPCSGPLPTLALRQAAVAGRIGSRGGQSIASMETAVAALGLAIAPADFTPDAAAALAGPLLDDDGSTPLLTDAGDTLGVDVPLTISEFRPFVGGDTLPGLVYTEDWANTWRVNAPPISPAMQLAVRCALERIKPAHTVMQITFG